MYLVVSESPVFAHGARVWLTPECRRDLVLLREALEDRLGPMTLLAPTLPASGEPVGLEAVQRGDGLRVIPSVELHGPTRAYWLRDRRRWHADLQLWARRARVVEAALGDVARPMAFDGFREARRQDRPTVFVVTSVPVAREEVPARPQPPLLARVGAQMMGAVFDGAARYGVRAADLALLRAGAPFRRFCEHAHNPRAFHHASYVDRDVVEASLVEDRLRAHAAGSGPLRLACLGALDRRLGADDAIDALRLARQRGIAAVLDVIGEGDDRRRLESRIASLGLRSIVRFTGPLPAGEERYRRLAAYDVLVFTADRAGSARPLFEGFAAGLPAVGYAHDDLRQRAEEDGAAVPVRDGDVDAVARVLSDLVRDRERLAQLSRAAHRAARFHSADAWARRRAAWTLEAVEAREARARAGRLAA